jgi:AAA+ superfamily predicted ATPase
MVDEALMRRFDLNIKFDLPTEKQIKELVELTLKNGQFKFNKPRSLAGIIKNAVGLSYFSIQKTLITAIKRSLFNQNKKAILTIASINVDIWKHLLKEEISIVLKK